MSSIGFVFSHRLRRADNFLNVVLMIVFFGGFVGPFVFLVKLLVILIVLFVLRDFGGRAFVVRFFV
jgi:hypothetical protein